MDIFHRHRQAEEHASAASALEQALHVSEYRPEALIWKGIEALPTHPKLAFIFFSNAVTALPKRPDLHALLGRCLLDQAQPQLATRYLAAAWQKQPNDAGLRQILWHARSQLDAPEHLERLILAQLPEITSPQELNFVLRLLAAKTHHSGPVGVVRYEPSAQEIQGWAIDLKHPGEACVVQFELDGRLVDVPASRPDAVLTAAGITSSHGGIRAKLPKTAAVVSARFKTGQPLQGSPVQAMPAWVPPAALAPSAKHTAVDVLIPVYNGLEETLACINSAIEARRLNRTPHRLVVIEDATPLPALRKALKVLAGKSKITLVQNPTNLGFIRSMNRAMAMSLDKDVIWLNADTRVHGDWIDRLRQVAYSDSRTASVTPFTNNGELMSFPQSRISQPMPSASQHAELDTLAKLNPEPPVEIETGCGFCLYIKREAIAQVGYLDEVELSRGYGEETDWCLRARSFGWKHLGAPNVFVAHQGGVSFGEEKNLRVAYNNALLRQRYPDAEARYEAFCRRDPIKPARQALQRARLDHWLAQHRDLSNQPRSALHIHDGSRPQTPFSLTWHHDGLRNWVTLHAQLLPLEITLDYAPSEWPRLLQDLRGLPLSELVFEQLINAPSPVWDLPTQIDMPYRILCQDDALLDADERERRLRFATSAQRIELPSDTFLARHAAALPGANLVVDAASAMASLDDHAQTDTWLIGDDLGDSHLAMQWLALAQRVTRERLPAVLLIEGTQPWSKRLLATGAVHTLPNLAVLSKAENVTMSGCGAVMSLQTCPVSAWRAAALAHDLDLPLHAPFTSRGDAPGVFPFPTLSFTEPA
ncbi:glycosyltransferase family 2 protein [Pseudomonas entomophila]|uniref:glycosyltransferase family 2 protein n=1 Tax=Pseudomonas entomophila TaxID=312306 RepID=UPI0015E3AE20|nr:glycosyltransferase family 2 protein [Pseudomonas entomophila]MBA1190725.1 glycosyltransferase family 2 protein [Pseudomonas entomophila]